MTATTQACFTKILAADDFHAGKADIERIKAYVLVSNANSEAS